MWKVLKILCLVPMNILRKTGKPIHIIRLKLERKHQKQAGRWVDHSAAEPVFVSFSTGYYSYCIRVRPSIFNSCIVSFNLNPVNGVRFGTAPYRIIYKYLKVNLVKIFLRLQLCNAFFGIPLIRNKNGIIYLVLVCSTHFSKPTN